MMGETCLRREHAADVRERAESLAPPGWRVDFAAFYRAERGWLFHYFRRRIGRDAAPDLVQEAFTRLLRSGAFDRVAYPRPYLARIAHNLLIERARKIMREGGTACPFDESCDAPVAPEQERRIESIDLRRAFRPVLLAMPARTRRIFLMHRLRGMTYAEIAAELGLSAKTVEKHMGRALARCRKVTVGRK
ncbi:RNA polymerase sigma factor [Sphingopyxis sp. MWB1]|uniref:RNA polymerase sigma factor n=1 Tax=Sphingopyxis sp. MWB1 TaxID=1537715 RepID=UPI0009E07A7D